MAGHMGHQQSSSMNLEVAEVRPEQNLLLIKGAVPGNRNSVVLVRKARKA
jgi:large subunit ribosomal protein L3